MMASSGDAQMLKKISEGETTGLKAISALLGKVCKVHVGAIEGKLTSDVENCHSVYIN